MEGEWEAEFAGVTDVLLAIGNGTVLVDVVGCGGINVDGEGCATSAIVIATTAASDFIIVKKKETICMCGMPESNRRHQFGKLMFYH